MSETDPDVLADLERARILAADGLTGEAMIQLRRIIHGHPELPQVHFLMAALLFSQQVYGEALNAAERCLELDPEYSRAGELRDACQQSLETEAASGVRMTSMQPGAFVYKTKRTKVTK
ncbi:MAG: tetratricopeptide repeat protein, partial [bacterium]